MAIEEQNSLERGAGGKNLLECSKQNTVFPKKFFTKIFPLSHRIIVDVKKGFIFRFTKIFSNFFLDMF